MFKLRKLRDTIIFFYEKGFMQIPIHQIKEQHKYQEIQRKIKMKEQYLFLKQKEEMLNEKDVKNFEYLEWYFEKHEIE